MSDPIVFDRKPYTISYRDQSGAMRKIRRQPPAKLHDALPTDVVTLNHKKNDDFDAGDKFTVKHINPRHPNVLQIENAEGVATFVPFFDVEIAEKRATADGVDIRDTPIRSKYLLWP